MWVISPMCIFPGKDLGKLADSFQLFGLYCVVLYLASLNGWLIKSKLSHNYNRWKLYEFTSYLWVGDRKDLSPLLQTHENKVIVPGIWEAIDWKLCDISPGAQRLKRHTESKLVPYHFALQSDSELGRGTLFSPFRLIEIFNLLLLLFLDFYQMRILESADVYKNKMGLLSYGNYTLKQLANSSTYNAVTPLMKKKSSLVPDRRVDSLFDAVLWCCKNAVSDHLEWKIREQLWS